MLSGLLNVSERILDGVSSSFSPPLGASAKQVRINGAISVAAGAVCLAAGVFVLAIFGGKLSSVGLAPIIAGHAFVLVGGYRLVFGVSAKADAYEVMSLHRILFGVVWLVFMFGVPILAIILLGP